jgi:hypothetical protein
MTPQEYAAKLASLRTKGTLEERETPTKLHDIIPKAAYGWLRSISGLQQHLQIVAVHFKHHLLMKQLSSPWTPARTEGNLKSCAAPKTLNTTPLMPPNPKYFVKIDYMQCIFFCCIRWTQRPRNSIDLCPQPPAKLYIY